MGGGLLKPKNTILGADIAGRVETIGGNVKQFRPGDAVFGDTPGPATAVLPNMCPSLSASWRRSRSICRSRKRRRSRWRPSRPCRGLRDKGRIQPGQKVLINGASGGVGTFAVQLAKAFGADVTAVCSTGNMDMARSLGADHVIDYTREDFTRSGRRYDLWTIMSNVGERKPPYPNTSRYSSYP